MFLWRLARSHRSILSIISAFVVSLCSAQEVSRTTLGPAVYGSALSFSENFAHVAYIGNHGSRQAVFLDGKPGADFDKITSVAPALSADGRHCIYAGTRGRETFIVVDGKEFGPFDEEIRSKIYQGWEGSVPAPAADGKPYDRTPAQTMVFSPDGTHFAFAAKKGGETVVYEDGKQIASGRVLIKDALSFSSQGNHLLFALQDMAQQNITVYVDGIAGPALGGLEEPHFSADGRHVYYVAHVAPSYAHVFVLDGKPGPGFGNIMEPQVSADAAHFAYVGAGKGQQFSVVLDGKPVDGAAHVWLSPDGRHNAYLLADGHHNQAGVLVVDGKPGQRYDSIAVRIAPDGHIVYTAMANQQYFLVDHGVESPAYTGISLASLVYSRDGKHSAYVASDPDGSFVVLDGKPLKHFHSVAGDASRADRLQFLADGSVMYYVNGHQLVRNGDLLGDDGLISPDGKRVASIRLKDQGTSLATAQLTMDGVAGPVFTHIRRLTFSPDSRHYAYIGGKTGREGGDVLVVDGASRIELPDSWAVLYSADSQHLLTQGVSHSSGVNNFVYLDEKPILETQAASDVVKVWSAEGHSLLVIGPTPDRHLEMVRFPAGSLPAVNIAAGGPADPAEAQRMIGSSTLGAIASVPAAGRSGAGGSSSYAGVPDDRPASMERTQQPALALAPGSVAHVRLVDAVNSDHPGTSGTYRGELSEALVVPGGSALAAGTGVQMRLARAGSGWALTLVSVAVNGGPAAVGTNQMTQPGTDAVARARGAADTLNGIAGGLGRFGRIAKLPRADNANTPARLVLPPGATVSFTLQ